MWTAICACATFCLYFVYLVVGQRAADVVQTATGSKLVWPSIIEQHRTTPMPMCLKELNIHKGHGQARKPEMGINKAMLQYTLACINYACQSGDKYTPISMCM